jgi:PKD repeat protein
VLPPSTQPRPTARDRAQNLPPPLALYAASRRNPFKKSARRWVVPALAIALVLASGVAAAAYWPFPRPVATAPLEAAVEINRTSGTHPLSVSVEAEVSGGTPPYSYAWTFGDGGTAAVGGATHEYEVRGTYQVLLRVTDHDNRTAAAGVTVTVAPVQEQLMVLNASGQNLGPGESRAWITPISIPSTSLSAWVYGSTNVTGCSFGGNCAAFVEILNVHDETNLTQGDAITNPIWCWGQNGTCHSNRTAKLNANLEEAAGQTVYLVLFNDDYFWSQSVSAQVWLDCSY